MLIRLILLLAIIGMVALFFRSLCLFRMVMWDGQVTKQRKTVPGPLRAAIADLASERKLTGTLSVYPGGYIRCSRSISEPDRQRLRNVISQFL